MPGVDALETAWATSPGALHTASATHFSGLFLERPYIAELALAMTIGQQLLANQA
jgi:hypothetical protein